MKYLILAAATLIATAAPAFADEYVNGYERKDGTYVQPYERTAPNATRNDNYSTQGNTNPYTGQAGTVNPQPQYNGTAPNPYAGSSNGYR